MELQSDVIIAASGCSK